MADTLKYFTGTLTTSEATVYTVPANRAFIMQGFWVSNNNINDKHFTLKLDDKRFASKNDVPFKDTIVNCGLEIPVLATKTIKVTGEVDTDMDYAIWGIEVDV